jgi:hypothetical protein
VFLQSLAENGTSVPAAWACKGPPLFRGWWLSILPEIIPNHEVLIRAAIRLLNELQRLDERDFNVPFLDQGGERLGGDFLEFGQRERALSCGDDLGDRDGVWGFAGGDARKAAIPSIACRDHLGHADREPVCAEAKKSPSPGA